MLRYVTKVSEVYTDEFLKVSLTVVTVSNSIFAVWAVAIYNQNMYILIWIREDR